MCKGIKKLVAEPRYPRNTSDNIQPQQTSTQVLRQPQPMHHDLPHFDVPACSQEAGGNNCLCTDDASLWRRHSTSSSAKVTLRAKATKHAPATSNNSKPTKLLRSQITLAIEHIEITSGSTP